MARVLCAVSQARAENLFWGKGGIDMKKISLIAVLGCLALAVGCAQHNTTAVNSKGQTITGDRAAVIDRLNEAGTDLTQLMGAPDSSIPAEVLESAKCVAVVPSMVKGGFVIGGQHGRGVATCRTGNGWSTPAFFTVTGGSWGAQIGVEAVDLVMVIMNDKGMNDLMSSNFKLGAEGGVAAGPVGREAQASTDWKLKSEVLTYSRTRGVFAGLDLSGAAIRQDADSTTAFYGKTIDFRSTLTGKVNAPADATTFLSSVRKNFAAAKAQSD